MKNTLSNIRALWLTLALVMFLAVGNEIMSQSFDKAYEVENKYTEKEEIEVKVYPNPATEFVTVTVNNKFKGNYKLNNIFGKMIEEGELTSSRKYIDLLKYRTGIYILCIYDKMGQKLSTRKIIKN